MEDHLNPVLGAVKQLTSSEAAEDRVLVVINHIVSGDGRQRRGLGGEDASLQLRQVVSCQEIVTIRNLPAETCLVESLSDVLLDVINRILETLCDGVTPERLHVEAVRLGGEDEEGDHSDVTVGVLQQVIQPGQRLDEHVCSFVCKLISREKVRIRLVIAHHHHQLTFPQ